MRILVGVLVVTASSARADIGPKPTPFDQGHFTVSVLGGSGTSANQRYVALGAGAGYFVLDGLELEASAAHWFTDGPSASMMSGGARYLVQPLVPVSPVIPYVGGFYRHYFYGDGFEDVDTIGGRAGLEYLNGRFIAGGGVAVEHAISDCTVDCTRIYPELSLGFLF